MAWQKVWLAGPRQQPGLPAISRPRRDHRAARFAPYAEGGETYPLGRKDGGGMTDALIFIGLCAIAFAAALVLAATVYGLVLGHDLRSTGPLTTVVDNGETTVMMRE